MSEVLGSRPLPETPRPVADLSALKATSVVLRSDPNREQSIYDATKLLGLVTRSTIRQAHEAQQKQLAERQGEGPPAEDGGMNHGYVEPPFDLENLTQLLFQSWEYFAINDQLAIDAVAGGVDLVDAEGPGEPASAPEQGEIDYDLGAEGPDKLLRTVARDYLDHLCRDAFGAHISVEEWGTMMVYDYKSTGQMYSEVVRGEGNKIVAFIHMPSRLIVRHAKGRTYAQVGDDGREIAYFRRFGMIETKADAPELYFSADEVAQLRGRGKEVQEGALKPELLDHKIYHPNSLHYGVAPIVAALPELVGNIYSKNRNLRFFFNRGMPDYLVVVKAEASSFTDPIHGPIINQFADQIEEHMKFLQEGEDYRVLVVRLPTGQIEVELEKLGTSIQDQEFAGYQHDNSKAIIRVYRMMPERLGIIETAQLGSGSGESQAETYKRSQVDPLQAILEADLNAALDSAEMKALRAKFPEIDVLDEAREMSLFVQADNSGNISVNEGRAWLGRIVKDQEFPEVENEWANIPKKLLEYQMAQLMGPGEGGVRTWAAGVPQSNLIRSLLQPKPAAVGPPRPTDAEDQAAVGGQGRIMDRMRAARTRMLGNGGQVPQPSATNDNGFRREAVRL